VSVVRIAAVSARSTRGGDESANVARAVEYIREAAAGGANIICFPEGYPGPYKGPADFSPLPALQEAADEAGAYVVASMVERVAGEPRECYRLMLKLIGPDGELRGSYARVLPNPREMHDYLMGGKVILPGDDLPVFETEYGVLGLLVCSEAWSPELPLIMALQGAEILLAPIGGAVYELAENWHTVLRARAYENNMAVVTCQNIWGAEDALSLVVGPEGVAGASTRDGVLLADLDLERLRWLRSQTQDLTFPKPYRSVPGMLRHRRPDLYHEIVALRDDLYDFWGGGEG
jgi:predicted amidohydrolase